jgi:hypothetical protein
MTIYDTGILDYQSVYETGSYDKLGKRDGKKNFDKLSAEIIDTFGLDEIGQMVFNKEKSLIKLRAKRIMTRDESLDVHIQIKENELKSLTSKLKIEDIRAVHSRNHRILRGWCGFSTKELTIFDYYSYLRDYQKEVHASSDNKRYTTKTGYSR